MESIKIEDYGKEYFLPPDEQKRFNALRKEQIDRELTEEELKEFKILRDKDEMLRQGGNDLRNPEEKKAECLELKRRQDGVWTLEDAAESDLSEKEMQRKK